MDRQLVPAGRQFGQFVRQSRQAEFRSLVAPVPVVIRVTGGEKRVGWSGERLSASVGAMILLPEALALDIENIPGVQGSYRAEALSLPRARIEAAYARLANPSPRDGLAVCQVRLPGPGTVAAFERLFSGSTDLPEDILAIQQEELVLWLARDGAVFAPSAPERLSDLLRKLLAATPGAHWPAARAAAALAMREPTLRRRLASEGQRFSSLLQDVRMTHALALLQGGETRVGAVAAAVGYESPSRFAVRFRARFGAAPHEIARPSREIDRIGTMNDRDGRAVHGEIS